MRIQLALAAAAALVSSTVFAHVELGTYKGVTAEGAPCEIEATREWHEMHLHHGLNHRVEIKYQDLALTLAHPPTVDKTAGTVRFDHDHLVGTLGIEGGAVAFVLDMDHTPGNDGPRAFTMIYDSYANAAQSLRWTCSGLKHEAR